MNATSPAEQITVHMIGNAHIDPVWLWPVSEGRAEVLSTYRTAIMLIREFDGYVFTSGGAVTYQWVAEDDPALFRAIQEAVAQGRWALVNGWWLQPDCNLPHGESFARHALYGQRFLQEHFGRRATVGYNVDSFGHAGTLPQLLKLGGLDAYIFFRPGPHEKELPRGPFWWEAPGGARVLACRPPLHYGTGTDQDVIQRITAAAAAALPEFPVVMCFYGVGNHGGGPTRRNVEAIVEFQRQSADVMPLFSSPERFFAEARKASLEWPVVRDELQHHSRGCYTALSRVKRENRQAEYALMGAERWASLAHLLCQTPDPRQPLREAWQKVLFNQFHDILAGTSIRSAYEGVWRAYEQVRQTAGELQEAALRALSARIHVAEGPRPILVWNPLPWERTESVRLHLPLGDWRYDFKGERYPGQPILRDGQGQTIPCQVQEVEMDYNTYVVQAEALVSVPALGARLIYAEIPETEPPTQPPAPRYATELENGLLRLRLDPQTGWLVSLWDLEHHCEWLAGPANVPLVIEDPSDTWSHDVDAFRDEVGRFAAEGPAEFFGGPVRQGLRVRSRWGRSTIVQEISLVAGARAVEVTFTVDWHEQHKMLKIAFPLALAEPVVTASAPYGWVTRPAHGQEEPCQSWVDLSGMTPQGPGGVCLINDSKYGYDALGNELRLSILRSPIYAFHRPRQMFPGVTYHYLDQGTQTLRYQLWPHRGPWQGVQPDRRSAALHEPLLVRPVVAHAGPWREGSLLRVSPDNVVLTVVKLAEDDGRLIVRGYETDGRPAQVVVTSDFWEQHWASEVGPHEIWTWALPLEGGAPTRLDLLEETP